jgi:predicted nuclease of restriction endonuclease-like RecB superfamily
MRLGETSQVLSLSGRDVYVPDLAFHRGSKTVLLEVVWPWRKLRWSSYYERFRESAPPNALLLISAKSVAKSAIDAARDPRLISFRVTPIADKVVEAAERLL